MCMNAQTPLNCKLAVHCTSAEQNAPKRSTERHAAHARDGAVRVFESRLAHLPD
jgi:hypothetical protein